MEELSPAPRLLKEILAEEIDRRDWRRAKWAFRLRAHWSQVVGPYLVQHTLLVSVDDATIVIAVPSSSWNQELTYWKPEIQRRLNEMTQGDTRHAEVRVQVWPKLFLDHGASSRGSLNERGTAYIPPKPSADSLSELFCRVRDNYQAAVEHWIQSGYKPCERCQSPTLSGYRFCVRCERAHHSPES